MSYCSTGIDLVGVHVDICLCTYRKGIGLIFRNHREYDIALSLSQWGDNISVTKELGEANGSSGKSFLFCFTSAGTMESFIGEIWYEDSRRAWHLLAVSGVLSLVLENLERDTMNSRAVVPISAAGLQG